MRVKDIALDGVVRQNPTFRLVLGTCPTLALTTAAFNGIGMGLSVTFVLICSNVFVSLLRKIIPDKVRIPAFVLIIATFVTVVQMVLKKFMPDLYDSLGVFLPLIVVNCIILARAESFASHNKVGYSALDGLFMGLGLYRRAHAYGRVQGNSRKRHLFRHKAVGLSNSVFQLGGGSLSYLRAVYPNIQRDLQRRKQQGEAQARLA